MKKIDDIIFLKDKEGKTSGPYSKSTLKNVLSKPHNFISWLWFTPTTDWETIDLNNLVQEEIQKKEVTKKSQIPKAPEKINSDYLRSQDIQHLDCSLVFKQTLIQVKLDEITRKGCTLFIPEEVNFRNAPDIPLLLTDSIIIINILNTKDSIAENCKAKVNAIKKFDKKNYIYIYHLTWVESTILFSKILELP